MHNDIGSVTQDLGQRLQPRASDPHDFAGLYLRHRSSFTLHARRYLKDQRDADEVVQEAFLRLFLALPELETELQALAYCRRTITNLAIDRYRADARRPKLVDLDSAPVADLAGDDPGDPVVRAEEAALVRDALGQLPSLHRAALVKREIEEKPLSVIAEELDIPEDNVKHVLFRARRGLRKLLARTSVAPGADVEAGRRLPRPRSGGAAALAVLLALALGSGPNLEAVPVVGVDLPDVIGVTRLVESVGDVVGDVVDRVLPGEGTRTGSDKDGAAAEPAGPGTAGSQSGAGTTAGEQGTGSTGPAATGPAAPQSAVGGAPALPGASVPAQAVPPTLPGSVPEVGTSGPGGAAGPVRGDVPPGQTGPGSQGSGSTADAGRDAARGAQERADAIVEEPAAKAAKGQAQAEAAKQRAAQAKAARAESRPAAGSVPPGQAKKAARAERSVTTPPGQGTSVVPAPAKAAKPKVKPVKPVQAGKPAPARPAAPAQAKKAPGAAKKVVEAPAAAGNNRVGAGRAKGVVGAPAGPANKGGASVKGGAGGKRAGGVADAAGAPVPPVGKVK